MLTIPANVVTDTDARVCGLPLVGARDRQSAKRRRAGARTRGTQPCAGENSAARLPPPASLSWTDPGQQHQQPTPCSYR